MRQEITLYRYMVRNILNAYATNDIASARLHLNQMMMYCTENEILEFLTMYHFNDDIKYNHIIESADITRVFSYEFLDKISFMMPMPVCLNIPAGHPDREKHIDGINPIKEEDISDYPTLTRQLVDNNEVLQVGKSSDEVVYKGWATVDFKSVLEDSDEDIIKDINIQFPWYASELRKYLVEKGLLPSVSQAILDAIDTKLNK